MTDSASEKLTDNDLAKPGKTDTEALLEIATIPQPSELLTGKNITPGRRPLFRR